MSIEAEVGATPVPPVTLPAPRVTDPISLCYRVWPQTVLAIGLIVTAAWLGLLVCGLFEIWEMLF
jgi:hypothetical protein